MGPSSQGSGRVVRSRLGPKSQIKTCGLWNRVTFEYLGFSPIDGKLATIVELPCKVTCGLFTNFHMGTLDDVV